MHNLRKRVFLLILAGVLTVGLLAGCGLNSMESENDTVVQSEQTASEKESKEETDMSEKTDTEDTNMEEAESSEVDGKTIVVYFSATGNTEQVAKVIAEATGGELFELEPVEPYTDADLDWTDENSRVGREHNDLEQREIKLVSTMIDDWESASIVYIGYAGGIIGLN